MDVVNRWNETHSPRKTLKVSPHKLLFPSGHREAEKGGGSGGTGFGFGAVDLAEFLEDDASSPSTSPSRSPKKKTTSGEGAKTSSPSKKQQSTTQKATTQARKDFDKRKEAMAISFVQELDERISGGEVGRMSAETGGIVVVWSKKLNSTAGRANWRKEVIRSPSSSNPPSQQSSTADITAAFNPSTAQEPQPKHPHPRGTRHKTTIELATKIIDSPHRLHNVLAHEYCHLANFTISRVLDNPHGARFKWWARQVTREFGASHGVDVTTKHDYEIAYKFAWICVGVGAAGAAGGGSAGSVGADGHKQPSTSPADPESEENTGCGMLYERHSKSVDVSRHGCGRCKGKLAQIRPRPRGGVGKSQSTAAPGSSRLKDDSHGGDGMGAADVNATAKQPTAYQSFVKENYATVKKNLPPGSPMKDVMREVGARYREGKDRKGAGKKVGEVGSRNDGMQDVEVVEILDSEDEDDGVRGTEAGGVDGVVKKLDFLRL